MCLGALPVKYGDKLNRVLYPQTDWLQHYVTNERLEYSTMKLYLMDADRRELGVQWQQAAEMLWSYGRNGQPMTEMLALDALEMWTGCRTYRQMQTNIGVDSSQVSLHMVELLGGERWTVSTGDVLYNGWYEDNFLPTYTFLADFHLRFEQIHPLFDGNGRWGRLLLVHGYGRMGVRPAFITDRATYLRAMQSGDVQLLASLL